MMMPRTLLRFMVCCMLFPAAQCSRAPTQITSGASGTELSACTVMGNVVDSQGNPVVGAIVRLRPNNYLSTGTDNYAVASIGKRTIADTTTGLGGQFRFVRIDTGNFSIEVDLNDSIGTLISCKVLSMDAYKKIPQDTLQPLSVIMGSIDAVDSNNVRDTTAKIQVYGLDRCVRPDSGGKFVLKVPWGNLDLKISADTGSDNQMDVNLKVLPNAPPRNIGSFRLGYASMPPMQCPYSNCDSMAVRMLLDSLKLLSVPVDSVATMGGGRIVGLNLKGRGITGIPFGLERLNFLQVLDLSDNSLSALPESMHIMRNLKTLTLSNNQLTGLFQTIGNLRQLQTLKASNNKIIALPDSIVSLTALQSLDLSNNKLCGISPTLSAWVTAREPDWETSQQCP
jgi:hypothetical protein